METGVAILKLKESRAWLHLRVQPSELEENLVSLRTNPHTTGTDLLVSEVVHSRVQKAGCCPP